MTGENDSRVQCRQWHIAILIDSVFANLTLKPKKSNYSLRSMFDAFVEITKNDEWWPWSESNQRHKDFQSFALPTELHGQIYSSALKNWLCKTSGNSHAHAHLLSIGSACSPLVLHSNSPNHLSIYSFYLKNWLRHLISTAVLTY
jgi:hypothetical protein